MEGIARRGWKSLFLVLSFGRSEFCIEKRSQHTKIVTAETMHKNFFSLGAEHLLVGCFKCVCMK